MTPHLAVIVATHADGRSHLEVLLETDRLDQALRAVEVFGLVAPHAAVALWLWEDGEGGPVLRVTDGRWRVEVPSVWAQLRQELAA